MFSGFYLALILVLFCLILRAVAIEFRNKEPDPRWRRTWDRIFGVTSAVAMLLFGVALGNILRGIPLDATKTYRGTFFTLLNPYALLVGLTGFAMLATHGALYALLKTDGALAARARTWARAGWTAFLSLLMVANVATVATQRHLLANLLAHPVLWLVPAATLVAVTAIGFFLRKGRFREAFLASGVSIGLVWAQVGVGLYPNLVPALGHPELSLTIHNASSSKLTLEVMLAIALVGMPIVLGYTIWGYRTFAGKVPEEAEGY